MKKIKILFLINIIVLIIGFLPTSMNVNSFSDTVSLNDDIRLNNLSSWWWEPLELLSAEFDTNNYFSRIAVDNSNDIHLVTSSDEDVLGAGTDRDVFYKIFDYETKSWSELELVSIDGSSYSENPDIAVDSTGTVHVVWLESADILGSGTDRDICYRKKTSSGWVPTEIVSIESDSTSTYLAIIADSNGVAHVAWEDYADYTLADGDQDIFYKHRSAAGIWSAAKIVTESSTLSAYNPDIQLDSQENVIIAWNDFSNILGSGADQDVFYRQLDKDFITWSPLKLISSESDATSASPSLSKGVDGKIHLVWYDSSDYEGAGFDADIFYKSYDSKLDSWSITDVVSTESTGTAFRPNIDVDGTNSVYVIWEDTTDVGGVGTGNNILFKYLDLNTQTWSSLAILTYDNTANSFSPGLAVDSLGHVHTIFLDSDATLLGSGADYDLFYKKFVGSPETPTLNNIVPNPTHLGDISISWTEVSGAVSYQIYRDISYISTVSGLTAIATVSSVSYIDAIDTTGTYFYTIIASNDYGQSGLSNIESVEVSGFFQSIRLEEILVLAAIMGGVQLILTTMVIVLVKAGPKGKSNPKTGKK